MRVVKTDVFEGMEPMVSLFQGGSNVAFDNIVNKCMGYIQGRAYKASRQFGLETEDCETSLLMSLWESAKSYSPEHGTSFAQYANTGFNKNLSWLFGKENRDNHSTAPCTKGDDYEEARKANKSYQLSSIEVLTEDSWDLYDPRADVENLICEQDAARSLLSSIKAVDSVAGDVVALLATGKEQREVAVILGYVPTGTAQKTAQNNWVSRNKLKCVKPAVAHYARMGVPIPLKIRF